MLHTLLSMHTPVKILTSPRLDWSWRVTKSVTKQKAVKVFVVSETQESCRFFTGEVTLIASKLVNFKPRSKRGACLGLLSSALKSLPSQSSRVCTDGRMFPDVTTKFYSHR